ncbi:hypothetical protein WJX73_001915 [Symbiochloris irregularis]|uniref:Uncharacterized protein n=1 Tax=Symbiochloris irregularis TaxID=706552 RepID=A0AAW1PRS4_9CHLO
MRCVLPPRHPMLSSSQVGEIRAALAAFGTSQRNLRAGQISCQETVCHVLGAPKFAPYGQDFAMILSSDSPTADDGSNDACVPGLGSALSGQQEGLCIVLFSEGEAGDAMTPPAYAP